MLGPECRAPVLGCFCSADVRRLLHNKFVVILGDSIQRSVYKDLVKLLKDNKFLSEAQLKRKGESSFENDTLVEGGVITGLHNGTTYREVRQYRSGHHLVRFYFLTRVYSTYLESVLSDFQKGPRPDVLIVNSCVWDLTRYNDKCLETYKSNLETLFGRLTKVLNRECLIIWTMTMPVGYRDFETSQAHNLRPDIVDGNFFSATIANLHKLDVVDMHYRFRRSLHHRCRDAVHWNRVVHRQYTQVLLSHIAQSWGVEVPEERIMEGSPVKAALPQAVKSRKDPKLRPTSQKRARCRQGAAYIPGYTSFDESRSSDMSVASPFVNDSPFMMSNISPGYFTPPPGPANTSHAFAGRNFLFPNLSPSMSFTPFHHPGPYAQEVQSMKMMSRRRGWEPDPYLPYPRPQMYPRPPMYRPGI